MKQIVNRPFLLALFLSLPLWVVFGNYVVAAITALLVSFLLSMANALRIMRRGRPDPRADAPSAAREPGQDAAAPAPAQPGDGRPDAGAEARRTE